MAVFLMVCLPVLPRPSPTGKAPIRVGAFFRGRFSPGDPTMAQSFLADSIAQWYIRESAACDQITKETGEDFSLDPVAKEISDVAPAVFANNKHYPQLESITLGAMREMGIDYELKKIEPQYIAAVEAPEVREVGVTDRSMAFA